MSAYPIIILHNGSQEYLKICLEQAKFTNPNSRIILLGDKRAQSIAPDYVEFYDTKDYFNDAKKFSKVYKHQSVNLYNFELFCIQRWFIINEFIQKNGIEKFLHLDSDVLLYTNFEKENIYKQIKDYDMTISNVSGHTSFFNNKETMQELCDFIYELYANNSNFFKQFKENPDAKNIYYNDLSIAKPMSDMALLYFFANSGEVNSLNTMLNPISNAYIDTNIRGDSNYASYKTVKQVVFDKSGRPHYLKKENDNITPVKLHSLHCQGPSKILMHDFCTYDKNIGEDEITVEEAASLEYVYNIRLARKRKRSIRRVISNVIEIFIPSKKIRNKIRTILVNNYG